MGILSKIVGAIARPKTDKALDVISSGMGLIDQMRFSAEEKAEMKFKFLDKQLEARTLAMTGYVKDNSLHKVFALVFLVAWLILIIVVLGGIFWWFKTGEAIIPAPVLVLITTIVNQMNNKLNTVIDFLFGGSLSTNNEYVSLNKAVEKTINAKT